MNKLHTKTTSVHIVDTPILHSPKQIQKIISFLRNYCLNVSMIISNSILLLKSQISEDGQDKYGAILTANNFEVRQVKTLVFNFKNIAELKEKLKNGSEYSGLILSSPRCVEAVDMALVGTNCIEQWKMKHNFAVGEATHKVAFEKLSLECQGKESGNAMNLSKLILANKSQYSKPFLLPHGNLKSDTLNYELGKEGLEIVEVEVYDTIANPDIELDLAKVTDNFRSISEYIVFFSLSGFNSSINLIQKVSVDLKKIKIVAIGPVTEMAIKERDLPVYGVAKRPNPEELLNAILNR